MSIQRWENCPNLAARTLSPGLSVLVTAASQAPVPDAGKIKTCPEMVLRKSLFVPGPTNVPDVIRKAIDVPMEDHRAPDLPEFILPLLNDVKKVFRQF